MLVDSMGDVTDTETVVMMADGRADWKVEMMVVYSVEPYLNVIEKQKYAETNVKHQKNGFTNTHKKLRRNKKP